MSTSPAPALGLTMAVVASSTTPLLLLAGDLSILAASDSFIVAFKIGRETVAGRQVFDLGGGEWNVPQLRALLANTASGMAAVDAYEMDLKPKGEPVRRLVVNARNLSYGDAGNVRLLLTVTDVTEARLAKRQKEKLLKEKDDLLNEQVILLQELQHRVANSLQIIASVLLQSARRVQSDETRGILTDAHSRVMSVAALQRQLARSQLGDVELGAYFGQLCASISASMIHDPAKLAIIVDVDDSARSARDAVSLGLIVTELVINALKHAFPNDRAGKITVAFQSHDADWTLAVSDDGVGMQVGQAAPAAGLGTSIVHALAGQLLAEIVVSRASPGTSVTVTHKAADHAPNARPTPGAV